MRRYGGDRAVPDTAVRAWLSLGHSVYWLNPFGDQPIMLSRPALNRAQSVSFLHREQLTPLISLHIVDQL